ncbi:probable adenylate kinase 7, mitochondrial [Ipomoea triloba]|uniref:probable adenylate kinase 7, mitochondrial n=1 Tax=Ipomoea triloba TaxID=35885 RepID=UPI00125DB2D1|nr:probable adenylate kinase 7, mitochondrial [Ipomoea triloba]
MAVICRPKPLAALLSHVATAAPPLLRLLHTLHSRPYSTSSSALPQLDPDYYYHHHYDDQDRYSPPSLHRDRPPPPAAVNPDTQEWVPLRGVQLVFIGFKTKHLYAERLSKLLEVPHISISSILRQDLSPRSSLYKQIADAMSRRTIVPEEIIFGLLSKRLEDGYHRGETGFILDGIPRTLPQAEILDKLVDIDLVMNFKYAEDDVMDICTNGILSTRHRNSVDLGTLATKLGSATSKEEFAWREKLHMYANQIKPVEEHYKKQKKLLDIRVSSVPGETWQGLLASLHLQHMNVHPRFPPGPNEP